MLCVYVHVFKFTSCLPIVLIKKFPGIFTALKRLCLLGYSEDQILIYLFILPNERFVNVYLLLFYFIF